MSAGPSGPASSCSRVGEEDERYSGGAEEALRDDLRVVVDALGAAPLRLRGFGGGRTGEDDSAPDWKTLLSSHPLSSANWEHREYRISRGHAKKRDDAHLRIDGDAIRRLQPEINLSIDML